MVCGRSISILIALMLICESAGLGLRLSEMLRFAPCRKSIFHLNLWSSSSVRIILNFLMVSPKSVEFLLTFKVKNCSSFCLVFNVVMYVQSSNSVFHSFGLFFISLSPWIRYLLLPKQITCKCTACYLLYSNQTAHRNEGGEDLIIFIL